ncbi:hypothetical protein K440DRAFT_607998 [Wilcoxina mikolae CBS 423.85]|nr:hypothetical protein K440DRAFT_607998 [Wilcoxina mikolae CBS 423.85]
MSGSHSTPLDAGKVNTAANPDSVSNQGPFHASKPRDHPMTTKGHKPGLKTSPADSIPTFQAQTLPPGTAPKDRSFTPNNIENIIGDSIYPTGTEGIPGSTSADVHTGYGHPGQGMTSREIRHDGQQQGKGGKKQRLGLAKHAAEYTAGKSQELGGADPRGDDRQRALGKEVPRGANRGNKGEKTAEDMPSTMA